MATDVGKTVTNSANPTNKEEFGELFRKYYPQIYSICLSILKDSHDAEEVTSDTFIHAYLKIEQLKEPDKFLPWLKKIARNRSKDFLRSKRKDTIPFVEASTPTMHDTPERLLLKQELIDAIIEAVESLPLKDRKLIQAHIDGFSHKEISERLDISMQASKDRLYRVRKKVKAHIKDLLSSVFVLPKMLPLNKVISGGITAMKIVTSTKVSLIISLIIHLFGYFVLLTSTNRWLTKESDSSFFPLKVGFFQTKQGKPIPRKQPNIRQISKPVILNQLQTTARLKNSWQINQEVTQEKIPPLPNRTKEEPVLVRVISNDVGLGGNIFLNNTLSVPVYPRKEPIYKVVKNSAREIIQHNFQDTPDEEDASDKEKEKISISFSEIESEEIKYVPELGITEFLGKDVRGQKVVFCLDFSGSMYEPRYKIGAVVTAVKNSIKVLHSSSKFNIILFASSIKKMDTKFV